MKRDEFIGRIARAVVENSNRWLPEESTPEFMMETLNKRLDEHEKSIVREYLKED